jgi:predicted  nucleic acid-binding Zn-ribbon protein
MGDSRYLEKDFARRSAAVEELLRELDGAVAREKVLSRRIEELLKEQQIARDEINLLQRRIDIGDQAIHRAKKAMRSKEDPIRVLPSEIMGSIEYV